MAEKEKQPYQDDGRVVANMDLQGTPWQRDPCESMQKKEERRSLRELNLTAKERRAILLGALSVVLPIIIAFGILYFIAFLLLDLLWLR